ncbi:permease [Rhodococcus sp. F64268]|uniref:purine-cytosine permease family protein n=1 Tax=unclassified Rhodococcus (in: high G+C Gram-positive bacteria) TaxID=192944 RepID=UPI00197DB326|nr:MULTISPECIES: permease [unclassified Rhodococcus (in: high G+C Gram-positive bacteria)]MCK0089468.1 permease [Rhodococcus sp. F64268]
MPAVPVPASSTCDAVDDGNFSAAPVPLTARLGRWQVTMSYWSLLSAMVWLFYGALAASLYGTKNAILAIALSTVVYSIVNIFTARLGARFGLNSTLLTKTIFGRWGSILTAVLLAATTLYYALFESSTLAVAFQLYFDAGDIRIWYAVVVIAMMPLMLGSVQSWMGKLNGILLPFYVIGLVCVLIAAHVKFGGNSDWLAFAGVVPDEGRSLPGWLLGAILYMGIFVNMPNTIDFARFSKLEDETFHERVTFGWVFYAGLFVVNGIAGIYLVQTVLPTEPATEDGVVRAILASLGFLGLLFIVVSQTRVNSVNYYLSTTNFERILSSFSSVRLPRVVWVGGVSLAVFALMLTDVFHYLQTALNWQGVLVVGWVGVVLTHFALHVRDRRQGPAVDDAAVPAVGVGLAAWIVPSVIGIALLEVDGVPTLLAQSAQLVVLALAVVSYTVISCISRRSGSAGDRTRATGDRVPVA